MTSSIFGQGEETVAISLYIDTGAVSLLTIMQYWDLVDQDDNFIAQVSCIFKV